MLFNLNCNQLIGAKKYQPGQALSKLHKTYYPYLFIASAKPGSIFRVWRLVASLVFVKTG
jgi:hypothetical protein